MSCIEKKSRKKIKVRVKRQLHPSNQWIPIGTGNHYKGGWNHRTMSGNGVYVMQNGNHLKHSMRMNHYNCVPTYMHIGVHTPNRYC